MTDIVGIVEAAYDVGANDENGLLTRITDTARSELGFEGGVVAYTFDVRDDGWITPHAVVISGADASLAADLLNPGAFPPAETQAVIETHLTSGVSLATRIGGEGITSSSQGKAYFQRVLSARGFGDALTINTVDPTRNGCLFFVPVRVAPKLGAKQKARYSKLAAHIAAGLRLRRAMSSLASPATGEAVLDATGKVHHATGEALPASSRSALREAVRAVDRARGKMRKRNPEQALDTWRGLVAGRWSLVDRFEADGRRFVVAHSNAPTTPDPRALSPRESQVASYVALGHSNKLIAYELGISPSTVGVLAARAAKKLGARSRAALAAAFAPVRVPNR